MKYIIGIRTGFVAGALTMWIALNKLYATMFNELGRESRRPRYVSYRDMHR